MSVTGEKGGKPTRCGNAMGDILGGMNLVIGVLMAVNARYMTGVGQRIDVSLVDSVVASLESCRCEMEMRMLPLLRMIPIMQKTVWWSLPVETRNCTKNSVMKWFICHG